MNRPAILTLPGDCGTCRGRGEVAVEGTYGLTVSPEDLDITECSACHGTGVAA